MLISDFEINEWFISHFASITTSSISADVLCPFCKWKGKSVFCTMKSTQVERGERVVGVSTPIVTEMQVVPVAGLDSMLMTLSGAHAPYFTRNLVFLRDSSGNQGVGEIHGGEYTRAELERFIPLVVGQPIGNYRAVVQSLVSHRCRFRPAMMMERESNTEHQQIEICSAGGKRSGDCHVGPAWKIHGFANVCAFGWRTAAQPGPFFGLLVLCQ